MIKKLNCVLLIDDDEPTNFLSQMVIEKANCTGHTQIASSGQEALHYITTCERIIDENTSCPCPDLIFLDINMPAMNGWEFLQRYNDLEKEHRENIVMIMMTTSINPDDKLKAKTIPQITAFENKPLTDKKLEELLRKYFPDKY